MTAATLSATPRVKAFGVGFVSLVVAASAALALAVTAQAAPTKLVGTVGPGATISLKTTTGKRVSTLPRGSYSITVKDRSDEHNFAMRGPGVSRSLTGVDFVGTKTVTLKLDMRGSFGIR